MPNYTFKCTECTTEQVLFRPIDMRNELALCPKCGAECSRLIEANIQKYGDQKGVTDWERIRNRPR